MQFRKRTISALVSLAVTASIAATPAMLQPASAATAPTNDARASVTAECAAAHSSLATAKKQQAKAKKAVAQARKTLRAAKKSHRKARISKAKRALVKAKRRYAVKARNVNTAQKRMAYACAAPTSATAANGTGQKMDLLVMATGGLTGLLGQSQLTALLGQLLPGVSGALSPAQLTALLSGLNAGALTLDDATALLGGTFTTTELEALLNGAASPTLLLELVQHIVGQLSALTGGAVPVPASAPDLTSVLQTVAGVVGHLDPSQLGDLLRLLLNLTGGGSATLTQAQLTSLLTGLVPGLPALTPTQVTGLLGGTNASVLDTATLSNLLGDQVSATTIQSALSGGTDTVKAAVLENVIAQLKTLAGGTLTLPAPLDATASTSLVSTVTTLVGNVIASVPIVGPVVCTLLPILC